MTTCRAPADCEPRKNARIGHPPSQIFVVLALLGGACSSSLQAGSDGGPDGTTTTCSDIAQAYSDAVTKAQECTVGASGQCGVQVRASFWCNCTTWVNGGSNNLAAIANQYQAAGCMSVCNGICGQPQSLTCQADMTSSTGGRCKPPMLVNLAAGDDGGTFSVPVGYEIDITLANIGSAGYQMDVMLSSDAATVLEITIPAGPVNPGGPTYLYRLKAVAAGQVVVQIPHVTLPGDASAPAAYTITLDIT